MVWLCAEQDSCQMAVLGCRLSVTPAISLMVFALGFRPTPSLQLLQQRNSSAHDKTAE